MKILYLESTSHTQKRGEIIKKEIKKFKLLVRKLFVLNLRQKDNPKRYEKWNFQTLKDMTSTTERTPRALFFMTNNQDKDREKPSCFLLSISKQISNPGGTSISGGWGGGGGGGGAARIWHRV